VKIGILLNEQKENAIVFANHLLELLVNKGVTAYLEKRPEPSVKALFQIMTKKEMADAMDIIFVLGGDGTLLAIARELAPTSVPFLGFNLGNLGFLSEAEPEDLTHALDRVISGDYCIEERMMIEAEVIRDNQVIYRHVALNDIGIGKGSFSRMITTQIEVDGKYLGTYSGDGVILSTPTGSTAYSLSAGGPIVAPYLQAIILTPIAPHTLTARPIVLAPDDHLRISIKSTHQETALTIDGQDCLPLLPGDAVFVGRSQAITRLIKWQERSFFDVVRKKLQGERDES
jgi:NAD+ kinase